MTKAKPVRVFTPEEKEIRERAEKDGITKAAAAQAIRDEKVKAEAAEPPDELIEPEDGE